MSTYLLAAFLALSADASQVTPGTTALPETRSPSTTVNSTATTATSSATTLGLDGGWTIVYAEQNGRALNLGRTASATIRGDVLTFDQDTRLAPLVLQFGAGETLRASPVDRTRAPGTGAALDTTEARPHATNSAPGTSGPEPSALPAIGGGPATGGTTNGTDPGGSRANGIGRAETSGTGIGTTPTTIGTGTRAAPVMARSRQGVYIASRAYLCISLPDNPSLVVILRR